MIAIPPYWLLVPFGLFLAAYAFFAMANIVSLAKYGARNLVGLTATFLFVCGVALILFFAWQQLATVAWTEPITLFSRAQVGF